VTAVPKFSANLGFLWSELDLPARVDAAARAGFKAVEFQWPYAAPAAKIAARCRDHGISALALNTGKGGEGDFGLAALPGREGEFAAALDEAIAYALAIGATAVQAVAGNVPPERRREAEEVFRSNLALAAARAAPHGLVVMIEPLNRERMPDYFLSRSDHAAGIIADLGLPNLKMMFDVFHVAMSEGNVIRRLGRHFDKIHHVQIAAVPSRAEPDEGEIAYGAIFRALEDLGYGGWIGCEYLPRTTTDAGLGWMERLGVAPW